MSPQVGSHPVLETRNGQGDLMHSPFSREHLSLERLSRSFLLYPIILQGQAAITVLQRGDPVASCSRIAPRLHHLIL